MRSSSSDFENNDLEKSGANTELVKPRSKVDSFGNESIVAADISWKDLKVKVVSGMIPGRKKEKVILQQFSGKFTSSSLVAVMGASGAGKTTFLNALSGQVENCEGEVYVNSRRLTKDIFKKTCGFVKQNDVLLPHLTVYETLSFYANLVLPMTLSPSEKISRVIATIKKLGLEHCMNTPIGNDFKRGVSGGEKRRVSIAIELLKNPPILFLDEPTSGLDAKTALNLATTLAELAHDYNHTIICTIHQPRSLIYKMFDTLLLLARGTPVYYGPTSDAIGYFGSKGYPCPHYANPADFFIDLLTLDTENHQLKNESEQRIQNLIEQSKHEGFQDKYWEEIDNTKKEGYPRSFGTIIPYQIYILFLRSVVNKSRDRQYLFGRIIQSIVIAVTICILWWQMDTDQSSIQDRIAAIFMLLLSGAFSEALVASLVYPVDRLMYIREKASGMYRIISYYIATQLSELPLQVLVPTIYFWIVYLGVGFQYTLENIGQVYLFFILLVFVINSIGLLFGSMFQAQLAAILMPLVLISSLMFSGFYLNTDNIPIFLRWVKYLSVFYYAFTGVVIVEFNDRKFYCKSDQYLTTSATGTCSNGEVISMSNSVCPTTSGDQVIASLNIDDSLTLYQMELILLLFIVCLRAAIFFFLHRPPNRV